MNTLLDFFGPILAAGLVIGIVTGSIGLRRVLPPVKDKLAPPPPVLPEYYRKRLISLCAGLAVALAAAPVWSGPLGAADRFTRVIERQSREALDYYEMPKVTAHLHRGPLTRRLILTKPADLALTDFQTSELARLFSGLPGVSGAQWTSSLAGLPLVLEGATISVLGFLLGLLLAYLVELRRRYNAQWSW
jgi:Sec-independent protein secretion pathway component TatC